MEMQKIVQTLQDGDVIIYPTDTLYALGADATNPKAVEKIYEIKGRDQNKPLSIAVGSIKDIEKYAYTTPLSEKLAEKFLPGPLTLVLKKKDTLAPNLTSDETIAIRVLDHPLFAEINFPLTATSANRSGKDVPETLKAILEELRGVAIGIDEGTLKGKPSTLVDCRGEEPIILREGDLRLD